MKNLYLFLAFATLALSIGCKNTDEELVGKMQNDITTLENLAGPLGELGQKLTNIALLINSAPPAMKTDQSGGYEELSNLSTSTMKKIMAISAEYNDLLEKLKTLSANYSTGKIKTDEAKKEYEVLQTGLQGLNETIKETEDVADQLQTQYAKMSADWNAKAEEAAQ